VGVLALERPDDAPVAEPGDGVRVRELGYDYESGHPVLHGVSLEVPPNRRMVLVGESGAGKTTLVKLVAGLLQPTQGRVEAAGRPPGAVAEPAAWVNSVSQEVHVFAGTVAENLSLGRPDADPATLTEALRAVAADAWVSALPQGLATVVGEGAQQLTVAQAQHLALARLWLAGAPVVILDEATAEAGSAAARALEQAALAAIRGRTALIVAHRLTQAKGADAIAVLGHGRLVEVGTHDELIGAGGPYAAIWTAWATRGTH
jgi:ATP-binding cassette subfamily C protein